MSIPLLHKSPEQEICGNAGTVESVQNQLQVLHPSHRPLEISQKARDSHIPTAQADRGWKSGKPKAGFPLSHARSATITTFYATDQNHAFASLGLHTQGGNPPANFHLRDFSFSGSSCIGNESRFQAHLVLESNPDFRLISGLENAGTGRRGDGASGGVGDLSRRNGCL